MPEKRKSKRGSILVTLLFLLSVLAMLVATVASDSMQSLKSVSQSGRDAQAKYGAYAGLELVMNELRRDDFYAGETMIDAPRHGRINGQLGELNDIDYEVLIWNNMEAIGQTPPLDPISAPGGVSVHPNTVYMIAKGEDSTVGANVMLASLGGTARRVRPVFEDAAFARNKLVLEGDSLVDAWDSMGGAVGYVGGGMPGGSGSGSTGGGSGSGPPPTVEDYEATLGTDSGVGRTARLLGTSQINGHYRVGPGVSVAQAFTDDGGVTGGSTGGTRGGDGGDPTYGVATAQSSAIVAGLSSSDTTEVEVDTKKTDTPFFIAPYDPGDLDPGVVADNPSKTEKYWDPTPPPGSVKYRTVPPDPYPLAPGGYVSASVPNNQTLQLSSGVYYFHEDFDISGGALQVTGGDPVVVFVGKKATFSNATINDGGNTTSLQLCFCDEEKEATVLDALVDEIKNKFEPYTPPSGTTTTRGTTTTTGGTTPPPGSHEEYVKAIIAPPTGSLPGEFEGTSVLRMNNTQFTGSVSGKNVVTIANGGDIFGGVMGNVILGNSTNLHQDLSLKGSNLMNSGGWSLEGVHQIR